MIVRKFPAGGSHELLIHWLPNVGLATVVVGYLVLGIIYSVALPVLEGPDEMWHYAYVRHLVQERRLPSWDSDSPMGQESSQAPLYHATAALGTSWIDGSSPEKFLERNPHWGYPSAGTVNDNKNLFFHGKEAERFLWQDTALVVHIARFVSLAYGAVTVAFTLLLAREIFPHHPGLALSAAALVALNPQFLFISSAVSNDAATSAFCTISLWLLVTGLRAGYGPTRTVLLGTTAGLAALSKASGLGLLPLGMVAIALRTWLIGSETNDETADIPVAGRESRLTQFAVHCALFIGPMLLVSGWWYARNAVLYVDPFGLRTHLDAWWAHDDPLSISQVLARLPNVELSYWAAFGWGNIHLPQGFYIAVRVATYLSLVGLLTWMVRSSRAGKHPSPRAWALAVLGLWILLLVAALLVWMQLVEAALGRLLFPAVGAISVLITWGLYKLSSYLVGGPRNSSRTRRGVQCSIPAILSFGLLIAAVASPLAIIRPAYAHPPLLSEKEITSRTEPIDVRFGESIRLVGFNLKPETTSPGNEAAVTLCWKSTGPLTENYAYFVHFIGPNDSIVGARDTHPGLGRFPTSQWTAGVSFCDVVRVPVGEETPTPAVYDIEVGWYYPETSTRLPAHLADGVPAEFVTLGKIEVVPREQPSVEIPSRVDARLGTHVTLLGYEIQDEARQVAAGQSIDVTLYWRSETVLAEDYTVFLHLAAPSSSPYAQDDGQPREGTYPTSYWDPGLVVVDSHTIHLPEDLSPGPYPLIAGMYQLDTGERSPAFSPTGDRLAEDAVPLMDVEVLP